MLILFRSAAVTHADMVVWRQFHADFSMRAIPRLLKIWHSGFGVLSLFPNSAIVMDLKLCLSTQTCCLD